MVRRFLLRFAQCHCEASTLNPQSLITIQLDTSPSNNDYVPSPVFRLLFSVFFLAKPTAYVLICDVGSMPLICKAGRRQAK